MTRGSAEAVGSRRGRVGEGWLGPTEASPVASSARQKYLRYLPEFAAVPYASPLCQVRTHAAHKTQLYSIALVAFGE